MADGDCRVVFAGTVKAGQDVDAVKRRLTAIFKVPVERFDKYFVDCPVVARSNLDAATAERFCQAVEKCGAVAYIERDRQTPARTTVTPPPATASQGRPEGDRQVRRVAAQSPMSVSPPAMKCPKCGVDQPLAESCVHCGIVIAKYRAPVTELHAGAVAAARGPGTATPQDLAPSQDEGRQPPRLEMSDFSIADLVTVSLVAGLLNLILVGILLGPRMVWGFIVGHVAVNGSKLKNDDLWLGLRPMLWLPVCLVAMVVLVSPFYLLGALMEAVGVSTASTADPPVFLNLLTLPIGLLFLVAVLAPLQVGQLHSLISHTVTEEGGRVFAPLFPLNPRAAMQYLRHDWRSFLLGGVAVWAVIFIYTAPIGFAIAMTQLFNQLDVGGRRYRLEIPWRKALIYSALCIPTFGIANLFFVRAFFDEILPSGRWQLSRVRLL